MRYVIAALLASTAIGLPSGAIAQAADPYAADVARASRDRASASVQSYLDNIAMLYFALDCRVLSDDGEFLYALNARKVEYLTQRASTFEALKAGIRRSTNDGRAEAAKGCAYWKENPKRVLEVREAVRLQLLP